LEQKQKGKKKSRRDPSKKAFQFPRIYIDGKRELNIFFFAKKTKLPTSLYLLSNHVSICSKGIG
jgi:hypothetical protein